MPLVRTNFEKRHLSPQMIEVTVAVLVGASGAVTSYSGKGFGTGPADTGTVTKGTPAGNYIVVLPGRGSLQRIVPKAPVVVHATDALYGTVISVDLTTRTVIFQLWDGAVPAVGNVTSGGTVHFAMDVQETTLG